MSFDSQGDDAGRRARRPPFLCGDATLDHDSHDPGHQCCGGAGLPRNMTAPEHWSMGPTLHDAGAAMDQQSRIPPPRRWISASPGAATGRAIVGLRHHA